MKYYIIINFLVISCSIKSSEHKEYKQILKTLSKPIYRNSGPGIYSIDYAKLPCPSNFTEIKIKYEKIIGLELDSLKVKVMAYREKFLEASPSLKGVTITEIRKYYGKETTNAFRNGRISELQYYFNGIGVVDCYTPYDEIGTDYNHCSLLSFELDSNEKLEKVNVLNFFY
ncbi:MAG: hypothetical protein HOP11_08665 [Saprospiraceae bacterium]|nr:hypothetical protein [Saprospiraceae bacterium]